jgi:hypothetical protein
LALVTAASTNCKDGSSTISTDQSATSPPITIVQVVRKDDGALAAQTKNAHVVEECATFASVQFIDEEALEDAVPVSNKSGHKTRIKSIQGYSITKLNVQILRNFCQRNGVKLAGGGSKRKAFCVIG